MWYRTAKKILIREAGYSNELQDLRHTLQSGINPYDWDYLVPEYLEHSNSIDKNTNNKSYEWLDTANENQINNFKNWLENHNDVQKSSDLGFEQPIGMAMEWNGYAKPEWNVHFTNNADAITNNGFQYGHPELYGLHQTTYKKNRIKEPGYNFAFPADSRDAKNAETTGKYGNEAVIFQGGGADIYHYGDEEKQRVFWGKNTDPRMIFPIKRDREQGGWYLSDATGRELVRGKDYSDIVKWVKNNYRMLQSIKEKQDRKQNKNHKYWNTQRAASRETETQTYYHGTPDIFEDFDPSFANKGCEHGNCIYITDSQKEASKYGKVREVPFYGNILKEFKPFEPKLFQKIVKAVASHPKINKQELQKRLGIIQREITNGGNYSLDTALQSIARALPSQNEFNEVLGSLGYSARHYTEESGANSLAVFDMNAISPKNRQSSRVAQSQDANLGSLNVNENEMDKIMNQFIANGTGRPQFIHSGGKTHLLIHGSAPQNGTVYFYIGANEQFGNNPPGYVEQTQLDDWIQSKGYPRQTPVIGCYAGAAQGVNSEFGNQGAINLSIPQDNSGNVIGDQLYFGT